jgi:competence protein ComFC
MEVIRHTLSLFIDFLFPKSPSLILLESLSPSELFHLLPQSRDTKDTHVLALFDYRDPTVKTLIWELKYRGNTVIASQCAEMISDLLQDEIAERSLDSVKWHHPLLIPMPISSARRRERGWNQTELLGEALIKKHQDNSLFEYRKDILTKQIHTESQARTHATKREREENISHSMNAAGTVDLRTRTIILLDDVTTSGVTFNEARRALKEKGAKHILCVAIAH